MEKSKYYLITGAAGFVGYHLTKRLLEEGIFVIGVDNLNDYYDVKLKHHRLKKLLAYKNFLFYKLDINNVEALRRLFENYNFTHVINLAAQAGVRYSITNPGAYMESNIMGFYNILETIREFPVKHLIYASSSSVYGSNSKVPFEETDFVDNPVSLYAATKKTNELLAATYSHLYGIPSTGLRFFTVYGPMGRPDMAYYSFTSNFFNNEPIKIYNNKDFQNDLYRDFTYIDDIVEGLIKLLDKPPTNKAMHRILNIGNNTPVELMTFIATLEGALSKAYGKKITFIKEYESIKPGDVRKTYASTDRLEKITGFKPTTSLEDGLLKFALWHKLYTNDQNIIIHKKNKSFIENIKKIKKLRFFESIRYLLIGWRKSLLYVLKLDKEKVGYMVLEPGGGRFKFTSKNSIIVSPIYIKSQYRGKGLGKTLINCLPIDKDIFAIISPENTASINLFKKAGFQQYSYVKYSGLKTWRETADANQKLLLKRKGIGSIG